MYIDPIINLTDPPLHLTGAKLGLIINVDKVKLIFMK